MIAHKCCFYASLLTTAALLVVILIGIGSVAFPFPLCVTNPLRLQAL
jgi:hypothetical protein